MSIPIEGICPVCGSKTYAETCDVGVGYVQVEPEHCEACGWVEGCPHENECPGSKCTAWEICLTKKS